MVNYIHKDRQHSCYFSYKDDILKLKDLARRIALNILAATPLEVLGAFEEGRVEFDHPIYHFKFKKRKILILKNG